MRATAGGAASNVVDVYNGATGAWSTAQLSVARWNLAAASVGNVALFAGGQTSSALLSRGGLECVYGCVRVLCLRVLRYCGSACPSTASSLMRTAADSAFSNAVDVYNGATGAWSTAQLSVARPLLAAVSVGNVALFAGGGTNGTWLFRDGGGVVDCCVCVLWLSLLQCCVYVCSATVSSHARHCRCSFF